MSNIWYSKTISICICCRKQSLVIRSNFHYLWELKHWCGHRGYFMYLFIQLIVLWLLNPDFRWIISFKEESRTEMPFFAANCDLFSLLNLTNNSCHLSSELVLLLRQEVSLICNWNFSSCASIFNMILASDQQRENSSPSFHILLVFFLFF